MGRIQIALLTVLAAMWQMPAQADDLSMPETSHAPMTTTTAMSHPARLMTMEQVEAKFGAPEQKIAAVGEPPITRWVYDGYTVYFERQLVLHTVMRR
jgi:hypothetical protein